MITEFGWFMGEKHDENSELDAYCETMCYLEIKNEAINVSHPMRSDGHNSKFVHA
jgi:hypothetical protein